MLCEDCGKKEATVHLTQIIDNKKTVLNLCGDCAEKRGFHSPLEGIAFPLAEFLASILEQSTAKVPSAIASTKCTGCGMAFSDFSKVGRLGCGNCYKAFREPLKDLLRKIHGSDQHRGKVPHYKEDIMRPIKEERKLQEELKKAIEAEDFEMAAQLRDKIKSLDRSR